MDPDSKTQAYPGPPSNFEGAASAPAETRRGCGRTYCLEPLRFWGKLDDALVGSGGIHSFIPKKKT